MKPIKITVTGANALVTEKPVITSGTVGLPVEFTFDEAWNGLGKTAVFRAGSRSYPVSCVQSAAIVPWEVLEKGGVGLYIGVFGADAEGTVKIPTVWACVDTIAAGTQIPETVPAEPAADVYHQILAAANAAVETANSVRADADAGAFVGPVGPKGDAGAIEFVVVTELPAVGDTSKIYLLPEFDGEEPDRFGEYVFIEGAWERIGSAGVEVNLEEYVKATDFATADGTKAGVIKIAANGNDGLLIDGNGYVSIQPPSISNMKARSRNKPITSADIENAMWLGVTGYRETWNGKEMAGSYGNQKQLTEEEKGYALQWLGVSDLIAELTAKVAELEAMLNSKQ